MFGQLDDVVKLPQGIPDSTVNTVIKKSLVTIVKDGVTSALKQKEPIVFDAVSVPESKNDVVSLTFVPDFSPVLDMKVVVMTVESALPMDIVEKAKKVSPDEVEHRKTLVLERELQKTRMSLQSAVEELETTNEELQASNEELLAANEELQSANEELQSVNEELYSVNTEMQEKMVELGNLHSDIDSMIQSTDLGVLFLDSDLKVRKITPRAMDHFNFTPSDEGREINDFTKNFELPSLMDEITIEHKVFNTKLKTEFILRISPYRRNVMNKQVIEGAVLAFIDMTPEFDID
jgi:two-component system CheB/CheR fusion protein